MCEVQTLIALGVRKAGDEPERTSPEEYAGMIRDSRLLLSIATSFDRCGRCCCSSIYLVAAPALASATACIYAAVPESRCGRPLTSSNRSFVRSWSCSSLDRARKPSEEHRSVRQQLPDIRSLPGAGRLESVEPTRLDSCGFEQARPERNMIVVEVERLSSVVHQWNHEPGWAFEQVLDPREGVAYVVDAVWPEMVKFQKQLAGQIVTEWKEGYCDYKQLKRDVKRIKERAEVRVPMGNNNNIISDSANSLETRKSIGSPLVAISDKLVKNSPFLWRRVDNITVHFHGLRQPVNVENLYETEIYETELLQSSLIPMELALDFFRRLDAELNRVNRFFKLKEEEYTLRAQTLQLQMATLLDLRKALARTPDGGKGSHVSSPGDLEENKSEVMLDVWDLPSGQEAAVSKKQVQHAEKLLRTAFADFYRGLGHLKSFCSINVMAFSKILKKYDKVTRWNTSSTYLRAVETSYFASSEKVVKLMDRVENIFTLHLAKKSHRETMIYLRPVQDTSIRFISYFQGIFTGCSVAFLIVLLLKVIAPSKWHSHMSQGDHMNALISVSSTVGLVLLHLYMYAWNVYLWRGARINYAVLFEWAPGTELQYQQVLLVSTGLTSLWMLALIVVKLYPALPYGDLGPLIVLIVILLILFLPLDLCYRTTRVVLLRCMIHIIGSPLYKVVLADIFLADQLTSQVTALKNIQYLTCYYFGGRFSEIQDNACTTDCSEFRLIQYVVVMLPSWWRLMQCARRWRDEGDIQQVLNGGKYLSALVAAAVRVAYSHHETGGWLVLYVACSFISSAFGVYWDTIRDWGLLQSKSVNPWLRDHLLLQNKRVYYISMVANIILRMAWLFALVLEETSGLNRSTVDLVLAALEVIRRGHWNFYRLEYQHQHNFGDFKTLKQMPLPFQDFSIQQSRS